MELKLLLDARCEELSDYRGLQEKQESALAEANETMTRLVAMTSLETSAPPSMEPARATTRRQFSTPLRSPIGDLAHTSAAPHFAIAFWALKQSAMRSLTLYPCSY